jgi:tellurite resistance protein TerC
MPAIAEPVLWTGFLIFLGVVLFLDLFVFHRKSRAVTFREATFWVLVWFTFAMGFAGLLWSLPGYGPPRTWEFLTGYVLEQALSVDNLFVFVVIFSGFAVKKEYQHRVLFWGVLGAILLRGVFILAGAAVVERFHWVLYLFGLLLLYTGGRLLFGGDEEEEDESIDDNRIVKFVKRFIPITKGYRDEHFFVRENGKLMATPLFLVLCVVELSDVVFAVDSIPAIFAVTTHPFVVFTSNMFAILGLRNIYIILEELLPKFRFLEKGVSIVLLFIGVKILLPLIGQAVGYFTGATYDWHIPPGPSLAVVGTLLVGSIGLSWVIPEKKQPEGEAKTPAEPAAPDAPPAPGEPPA